jgi:hypothetical protein
MAQNGPKLTNPLAAMHEIESTVEAASNYRMNLERLRETVVQAEKEAYLRGVPPQHAIGGPTQPPPQPQYGSGPQQPPPSAGPVSPQSQYGYDSNGYAVPGPPASAEKVNDYSAIGSKKRKGVSFPFMNNHSISY